MPTNTPIFTIAKELNVDSNRIILACKKLGIDAKGATKRLNKEELERDLYIACNTMIEHEDAFIDRAFELGKVEGLRPEEVKQYMRYMADIRLNQLKLQPIYKINTNPLPWMDEMLNAVEHTNFFENRATEYSKAATTGTWEEAFS